MSDYSKADFPHEINLGRTENIPVYGAESASTASKPKTKKQTFYPSLYISGVNGLEDLPKEGYALIKFKRKKLSISEGKDDGIPGYGASDEGDEDKTTYSADLEVQELCLPSMDSEDGDVIDSLAEKAGISTGRKQTDPAEDDDSDDSDDEEQDGA